MNKLLLTVAILAASSSAFAGTMTTPVVATVSSGFTSTQTFDSGLQNAAFTDTISFALFNNQSNTLILDSVTLTLASTVNGKVTVQNSDTVAHAFSDAYASVPVSITGPGGVNFGVEAKAYATNSIVSAATEYFIPAGTFFPEQLAFTITSNGEFNQPNLSAFLSQSVSAPTPNAYQAPGTLTMTAGAGTYAGSGDISLLFGGSASSQEVVTLVYGYHTAPVSPVPEASGFSFVALGMGLVGLLARRRKI